MKKKSRVKGWLKTVFGAAAVSATAGLSANLALAPEKPGVADRNQEIAAARELLAHDAYVRNLGFLMDRTEADIVSLWDAGVSPDSPSLRLLEDFDRTLREEYKDAHAEYGLALYSNPHVTDRVFLDHLQKYKGHGYFGAVGNVRDQQAFTEGSDTLQFLSQCRVQHAEEVRGVAQSIADCAISAEKAQDDMTARSSVGGFLAGLAAFGAAGARRRRKEAEERRESDRFLDDITGGGGPPRKAPVPPGLSF